MAACWRAGRSLNSGAWPGPHAGCRIHNNKAAGQWHRWQQRESFMSRFLQTLLLACSLLASLAQAADADAPLLGSKKVINNDNPDNLYVGIGLFADMLNANLEYVTEDWGYIMLRAGRFHNIGEGFAVNASWRT